jgi:WD40 repeat protein
MLVLDCGYGVASLTFTRDSRRLIAEPSAEGPLELWTPATGERAQLPDPCNWLCRAPVVHPSGEFLFTVGRHLTSIALADRTARHVKTLSRLEGGILSPDGKWVVAGPDIESDLLYGYPVGTNGSLPDAPAWTARRSVEYERLGGFVSDDRFLTTDRDTLIVRDAATGEVRAVVPSPSHYLIQRAVAPDGRRFAAAGDADRIYIWDTITWADPVLTRRMNPPVAALAFHPTRPLLATIQQGQTLVKLLDASTGHVVLKFQWKVGPLRCVAFSPDGTLAAAGSASGKIVVWDVDE